MSDAPDTKTETTWGMGSFVEEFVWLHNEHARIGKLLDNMKEMIKSGTVQGAELVGETMEIRVSQGSRESLDAAAIVEDYGIKPDDLRRYMKETPYTRIEVRAKAASRVQ